MMDEGNPMHFNLNGGAKTDTLVLDYFVRPLCTKRVLIEVCMVDDSLDIMQVRVELDANKMCYVDREKYVESADLVMQEAVDCAFSDYLACQANEAPTCKFIDCFMMSTSAVDQAVERDYLFSACVPKRFG